MIDPTGLRPDQTVVMSGSPTPADYQRPAPAEISNRGRRIQIQPGGPAPIDAVGQVRVAEGEVGPCEPVPAADGPAPVRAPAGGWDFSEVEYAGWGFGSGPGR